MAPKKKAPAEPSVERPLIGEQTVAIVRLRKAIETAATVASETSDPRLASLARTLSAITVWAAQAPAKSKADLLAVEQQIAGIIFGAGVQRNHPDAYRLRRGTSLGSPRSAFLTDLTTAIDAAKSRKATRDAIARLITECLRTDWPGEAGPMNHMPGAEMKLAIRRAIELDMDCESMVRASLVAVGCEPKQVRAWFAYADKSVKRNASRA